jgi:O-antigen biosynthesis protein
VSGNKTLPACSLIVVNYNGLRHLMDCLASLQQLDYPQVLVDLIVVDNGSQDGSVEYVNRAFSNVRTVLNTTNNYASALNLGIRLANGKYIGFVNNTAQLDPPWLAVLVQQLETQPTAGAVGGKIRLQDGRIHSVGHRMLPDYSWEDIGLGEPDAGQYDQDGEVEGLCWAAVLFRRECLEDVGPIDEDFVMYFEDVEYAKRCQRKGWKLLYIPAALAYHAVGGSSQDNTLTAYFCNRNRFLYLAKHDPWQLGPAIETSVFWVKKQYGALFESLLVALKKLLQLQTSETVRTVLPEICKRLEPLYGSRVVDQLLARLQVILGYRKPSIAIYDHALHFIGGGQRYLATLASVLQDQFDITFIGNKPVTTADMEAWYGLDLSRCQVKTVPLLFYEQRGGQHIDPAWVTDDMDNPFEAIAAESKKYDIFINANQLTKVTPLSPISLFFCHFPDTRRESYFAVDCYTFIIANSYYTIKWLKKHWRLNPHFLISPPVEMEAPKVPKERIILSVGRFEVGGVKKQVEIVQAFCRLCAIYRKNMQGWKLVVVGGSTPGNPYLKQVQKLVNKSSAPIELKVNAPLDELQLLYAKSSIFWHLCGFEEYSPERFEHFGMVTVEAMQNSCAPIVFNGGGQQEIIEHGKSGFLINTIDELCQQTHWLVTSDDLLKYIQAGAYKRSQVFNRGSFERRVKELFELIYQKYATTPLPDPSEVMKQCS